MSGLRKRLLRSWVDLMVRRMSIVVFVQRVVMSSLFNREALLSHAVHELGAALRTCVGLSHSVVLEIPECQNEKFLTLVCALIDATLNISERRTLQWSEAGS